MPKYRYSAKNGPQEALEGIVEAPTHKEAVEKVHGMGYMPIRVEEFNEVAVKEQAPAKVKRKRVKSRDITLFSRQLASLLRAGVPILSSIGIISEQSESMGLKNILQDMNDSIKDGATLSSVLSRYPKIFSPIFTAMIRTGEDSGKLPETLIRISEYRAKQEELMSRFRMAMAYPMLMASVGLATIVFMLTFVMPRLMKLFTNMGQSLPVPTRVLIAISDALRNWWWVILIIAVISVILFRKQAATKSGSLALSAIKLRMPVFGQISLKASLSRFSRTMEILVKSGIPILKAIEISVPVVDNEVIKNQLRQSYKELEQGGSFGRSLKGSRIFPIFMTNLLIVGEESGRLDEALTEVADSYERDTDEAVKMMSSLMEPVMILVMGLIMGFIVVAMLLPIFEINVMVR